MSLSIRSFKFVLGEINQESIPTDLFTPALRIATASEGFAIPKYETPALIKARATGTTPCP